MWTSCLVFCLLGAVAAQPVTPPVAVEIAPPVLPAGEPAPVAPVVVLLRLTIDEEGEVSRVDVRESAGSSFDRSAMAAALRWRFHPARQGDVAVEVQADVPVTFEPPPAPPRPSLHPPSRLPPSPPSRRSPRSPPRCGARPPRRPRPRWGTFKSPWASSPTCRATPPRI